MKVFTRLPMAGFLCVAIALVIAVAPSPASAQTKPLVTVINPTTNPVNIRGPVTVSNTELSVNEQGGRSYLGEGCNGFCSVAGPFPATRKLEIGSLIVTSFSEEGVRYRVRVRPAQPVAGSCADINLSSIVNYLDDGIDTAVEGLSQESVSFPIPWVVPSAVTPTGDWCMVVGVFGIGNPSVTVGFVAR
jgi:hypothetical protein